MRIYLSFGDGDLGYNCAECGSACCRGKGFGATRDELVQIARRHPSLAYFAAPASDSSVDLVSLVNLPRRCFFLRNDGLCAIHADQGRDIKPIVCKTFPANHYFVSGEILIVDLNFMCPIRLWRRGSGDYRITHKDILSDISVHERSIVPNRTDFSQPPASVGRRQREFTPSMIDFEELCRDFASRHPDLDALDLWAAQQLMVERLFDRKPLRALRDREIAGARERLVTFCRLVVDFLGANDFVEPSLQKLARRADLRALTSTIRLRLLKAMPHQKYETVIETAARVLCALGIYCELAEVTGGTPLDLQGTEALVSVYLGPMVLLSYLDQVPLLIPPDRRRSAVRNQGPDSRGGRLMAGTDFVFELLKLFNENNSGRSRTLKEAFASAGIADGFTIITSLHQLWKAIDSLQFVHSHNEKFARKPRSKGRPLAERRSST